MIKEYIFTCKGCDHTKKCELHIDYECRHFTGLEPPDECPFGNLCPEWEITRIYKDVPNEQGGEG